MPGGPGSCCRSTIWPLRATRAPRIGLAREDLEPLLDAGIDVVATVEVRSIASLADVVAGLTGRRPDRVVPDVLLRAADQLELVDVSPEALRRRLAHGGLREAIDVDASTAALYRPQTLAGLRELALRGCSTRWPRTQRRRPEPQTGEIRERIVVGLSGGPGSRRVLDRAARVRTRTRNSQLHAVHVVAGAAYPGSPAPDIGALRVAAEQVGASFQQVLGDDVAAALVQVAAAENATQLVVGVGSRRPRRPWHTGRGIAEALLDAAPDFGIHVVPSDGAVSGRALVAAEPGLPQGTPDRRVPRRPHPAPPRARRCCWPSRPGRGSPGRAWPCCCRSSWPPSSAAYGLRSSARSSGRALLDYYFIPPVHTLRVAEPHNVVTLVGFVLVGALVGAVVHRAASMTASSARAARRVAPWPRWQPRRSVARMPCRP